MKIKENDVLAAIDRSELRVRSSLAVWMKTNHDAFAARLKERSADWSVLARLFSEANLTDRRGNPPKPETARKIWQRVRKEVGETRRSMVVRPSTRADQRPIQSSVPQVTNPPSAKPNDDVLRVLEEMNEKAGKITQPLK